MYICKKRTEKSYIKLLNHLLNYDVISFDIFDTTIIRICDSPRDVFKIVAKKAKVLGIDNFETIRIKAQELAEKEHGVSTNLIKIYEKVKVLTGLNNEQIDVLQHFEIQTEAVSCIPNATTISLIKDLNDKGKKVVFTSDMYLDSNMIKEIFKTNGIHIVYDALFVSCEIGQSKSNGKLFEYIKNYYAGMRIVHVGDYWRSDIYNALKIGGIKTVYYPLAGKGKGKYQLFIQNSISAKDGYIFKWAYREFAPVLWNFCEWIYSKANEKKISELLFLTREGAFIQQLFDIYYQGDSIQSHTFYASRRSLLCASSDINWEWITQTFGNASVCFLFDAFHIDKKMRFLMPIDEKVCEWKDINMIRSDMEEYSKLQRSFLIEYIDNMVGKTNKIGLIDVGWKGSSQYFLEKIFTKEKKAVDISGFYFGEFYDKRHIDLDKQGFLCSTVDERFKEDVLNAGFIFENILSPEFGTTKEYKKNDEVYPVLEVVNRRNGDEIKISQRAIIRYFQQFKKISAICQHPDKEESISILFKMLENPPYKMAVELGDISYLDFGELFYVARPKSIIHYIISPREFAHDFKHCGWNSAFCRRCFKIPFPYFKIYKLLRRAFNNENSYKQKK